MFTHTYPRRCATREGAVDGILNHCVKKNNFQIVGMETLTRKIIFSFFPPFHSHFCSAVFREIDAAFQTLKLNIFHNLFFIARSLTMWMHKWYLIRFFIISSHSPRHTHTKNLLKSINSFPHI